MNRNIILADDFGESIRELEPFLALFSSRERWRQAERGEESSFESLSFPLLGRVLAKAAADRRSLRDVT